MGGQKSICRGAAPWLSGLGLLVCLICVDLCLAESPSARDVRISLKLPDSPEIWARCSLGQLKVDRDRVGFFKVGVLPLLVLENLDFELLNPSEASRLENTVRELAGASVRQGIEIRGLSLRCESSGGLSLSAGVARLRRGKWRLQDALLVRDGVGVRHREAILRLDGASLILSAPGLSDVTLLNCAPPKSPPQHPDKT
jgi:hypothetical protein